VPEVRLLPGANFDRRNSAPGLPAALRDRIEGDPSRSSVYKDVGNGIAPAGVEYFLPLFFDETATLFDYLPQDAILALHGPIEGAMQRFWNETSERHRFLARDSTRPILPPGALFLDAEAFFSLAQRHGRIVLGERAAALDDTPYAPLPPLAVERRAEDPVARLHRFAEDYDGRILIVADSAGRRETIGQMFAEFGIPFGDSASFADFAAGPARIVLGVAPLHEGFALRSPQFAILTETELYAASPRRLRGKQRERASNVEAMIRDLAELRIGDPVVHVEHGIGRYLGLQTIDLGGGPTEFLQLEYANEATLYVPVAQLHLIGRYSGADPAAAPLHQLGTGEWDKARRKAAKQVRDTAAELLNLYALRAARKGHAFEFGQHDYEAFAEGFGFEETPDQQAAIDAVLKDMGAGFPMDRLVCGDVGFGKTEVALRASFAAVVGGKQVAVLCPTTLLAEQHFHTSPRPLRAVAGEHRRVVAIPLVERGCRCGRGTQCRHGRHRDRHAQAAH
jgi:transcription-repair coupling factor (superfamily II helicase)